MGRKKEIWKPIKGWEKKYEVSNTGKVRNIETGLILSPLLAGCQYYYFMFYDPKKKTKNKRVKVYLHRTLAQNFIPNPYFYNEVNHKDGNKLNCSLDNLEWVSKSENSKHAVATGLHRPWFMDNPNRGEDNIAAKLSWEKVREIRSRKPEEGETKRVFCKRIGDEFGVHWFTVQQVLDNKSWIE